MNNKLIIDIGMHKGEDTGYYLQNGYTVIAVDADPNLIEEAKTKFKKAYNSKQLILLNYAVSDQDGANVTFNLSQNTIWNSLKENIADRAHLSKNSIVVETRTLSSIITEYGAPFYCKIDIEGNAKIKIRSNLLFFIKLQKCNFYSYLFS